MRQTSGIILNDDIFINSSHVIKIEKIESIDSNSYGENDNECGIMICLSERATPVLLTFEDDVDKKGKIIATAESKRNNAFNKIIMEMYGNNYAILNFDTK